MFARALISIFLRIDVLGEECSGFVTFNTSGRQRYGGGGNRTRVRNLPLTKGFYLKALSPFVDNTPIDTPKIPGSGVYSANFDVANQLSRVATVPIRSSFVLQFPLQGRFHGTSEQFEPLLWLESRRGGCRLQIAFALALDRRNSCAVLPYGDRLDDNAALSVTWPTPPLSRATAEPVCPRRRQPLYQSPPAADCASGQAPLAPGGDQDPLAPDRRGWSRCPGSA